MREKKVKMKFTDFERNLLINGINEWRNIKPSGSIMGKLQESMDNSFFEYIFAVSVTAPGRALFRFR